MKLVLIDSGGVRNCAEIAIFKSYWGLLVHAFCGVVHFDGGFRVLT